MPKHLQLVLNCRSTLVRVLPGLTPWFVAQDVAQALGGTWNGSLRLGQKTGVAARSLSFAQVRPWALRSDGKETTRMAVIGVHGLLQALERGSSPLARTEDGQNFRSWINTSVLPALDKADGVHPASAGTDSISSISSISSNGSIVPPAQETSVHQINTITSREMVTLNEENKNLYTTSLVIADGLSTDHASVIKLIRRHTYDLEKFGLLDWQSKSTSGRPTEYAVLSEPQATLLMTYMNNSRPIAEFKFRLIDAFYRMKQQLQSTQLQTRSAEVASPGGPKTTFSAMALHQAKLNDMLTKGQKMLADELQTLRAEHEDLEARVAALAALLEGSEEEGG